MEQVRIWFLKNKRDFPWREGADPYLVLVSEVMLQQTRAVVVVPYFQRWIERFPTIVDLSKATEDEVVKLWEGLGYYSRVRNLLALAKVVATQYDGIIPNTLEELLELKGIGDYTAGAILSFGFQKKGVALDGNVARVIARYLCFDKDVKKHINELRQIVYNLLPENDPHIVMEGLIELGATICGKKPLCHLCPLKQSCLAFKMNLVETLPILPQRKAITELFRFVGCVAHQDFYLLRRGEKGKVMAGLYEFPYLECGEDLILSKEKKNLEKMLQLELDFIQPLKREKHTFTRFKANLFPFHFEAHQRAEIYGYEWIKKEQLLNLPFSAGHRLILKGIVKK